MQLNVRDSIWPKHVENSAQSSVLENCSLVLVIFQPGFRSKQKHVLKTLVLLILVVMLMLIDLHVLRSKGCIANGL